MEGRTNRTMKPERFVNALMKLDLRLIVHSHETNSTNARRGDRQTWQRISHKATCRLLSRWRAPRDSGDVPIQPGTCRSRSPAGAQVA